MRRKILSLGIFLAGIVMALVVFNVPALREGVSSLERAGYFGAFVSGIMYALSFTAASATVIFAQMPASLNPWLVAIFGGLGAVVYDITVFSIFRRESHRPIFETLKDKLSIGRRVPQWVTQAAGLFILGSPLPDELAAGLFGFTNIKISRFILLSFLLNALGILLITGIF